MDERERPIASCDVRPTRPRRLSSFAFWLAALVGVLLVGAVPCSATAVQGDDEEEPDQDTEGEPDEEDSAQAELRVERNKVMGCKDRLRSMGWLDTDPIEIYYAEFLLAAWVLDHAPWNAYHSGLGLTNNRSNEKILFDFTPDNTSSVMRMVIPEVNVDSLWRAAALGEVNYTWNDGAHMEFHEEWPEHFTTFTRVGKTTGAGLYKLVDWVIGYYAPKFGKFNPVEVVVPHATEKGLRSRMCHDFVTDSLWVLYENGAKLEEQTKLFRDHIIMYANELENWGPLNDSRDGRKRELRYLRGLHLYLQKIKQQFTYAREALVNLWRLDLPVFVHDEEGNYHRARLVPPFLNYCYLPLAIPPAVYDPLTPTKLCALGLKANLTNVTTPFPWGHLLAAEEHIDQPVNIMVFAITVLCLAVASGGGGQGAK